MKIMIRVTWICYGCSINRCIISYRLSAVQSAAGSARRRELAVLPRLPSTRRRRGATTLRLPTARPPVVDATSSTAGCSGIRSAGLRPPGCRRSPACCRSAGWTGRRADIDHLTGRYAADEDRCDGSRHCRRRRLLRSRHRRRRRR